MRIAYLDCFAGIAGDMFLGALADAGVPAKVLHDATAALGLGARLQIATVDRSGISCTKVDVLVGDELAEKLTPLQQRATDPLTRTPETQHLHKTGHAHSHTHDHADAEAEPAGEAHSHDHSHGEHSHSHGRSLTEIRALIQAARLDGPVKATAIRAFELLGFSEAKIHNVPVDQIHFHEVGAVDAIVDIVAASAGIHALNVGAWHCSAINVGGGVVECAHGTFPVPAPATADLLRGLPTYSAHVQKELVTPTGAALLRAIEPSFGVQPAMKVEQIGYGAGTRNPKDFPNVLRLSVGVAADAAIPAMNKGDTSGGVSTKHNGYAGHDASETVTVIETALDDLSPQVLAYVAERALAKGALDVMLTPVIMKKGRPGTLLTVLCNPDQRAALERLILSETSTLGLRVRQDRRSCLERSHTPVSTVFGEIQMKIGSLAGEALNVAPEFEDCRKAAEQHNVAVKQVQQAAIAAYFASKADEGVR
jgi:uncharacterized protein (TIGR00299 family) protein